MTPHRSAARRTLTTAASLCAVAFATLAAACADAPTGPGAAGRTALAPSAAPRREVVDPAVYATGLQRTTWSDTAIVTAFVATTGGGTYRIPGGLRIDVPGGLFKIPQLITVTTLPGQMVAYEFQPHGLVFKKPLEMTQDLKGTNTTGKDIGSFEIGYFPTVLDVNSKENKALVREFLKASSDVHGNHLTFDVFHFSGYMVSTGRHGESGETGGTGAELGL